ncbi:hypothetical protein [Serratia sp. Se-RSBMAAmG]|uniref:hypothetical protein n=1 Tax=Serratia sp. Se-RSBMAAmG TaxID=3043305 RepID=UPI0024AFC731|nr:hypothetical protein [Serratia sp. Se-RSBMAAmG]MDI6977132.1 hypothetical protein [Serratia sp. Se-RSBMAAmG]
MKYFTREEIEYHIRKNYRIKENDNFLPYVLDKADKEGIDEIFFEKNRPLYKKMAFIRILRSAFPPSYYTKDNDYYEQKAAAIFLLAILFFFGAFTYAFFQQSSTLLSVCIFSFLCCSISLFIPLRFTSHYARKIFMAEYFYFLKDNIREPLSTADFKAFLNSYGPETTLNAIRYALFFGEVKGSNTDCLFLSSFIYYAYSENSRMELSRLYWPGIKKRVNNEITPELEARAKAIFDEKVADLNK